MLQVCTAGENGYIALRALWITPRSAATQTLPRVCLASTSVSHALRLRIDQYAITGAAREAKRWHQATPYV
jgi:hypothetical protein